MKWIFFLLLTVVTIHFAIAGMIVGGSSSAPPTPTPINAFIADSNNQFVADSNNQFSQR